MAERESKSDQADQAPETSIEGSKSGGESLRKILVGTFAAAVAIGGLGNRRRRRRWKPRPRRRWGRF